MLTNEKQREIINAVESVLSMWKYTDINDTSLDAASANEIWSYLYMPNEEIVSEKEAYDIVEIVDNLLSLIRKCR